MTESEPERLPDWLNPVLSIAQPRTRFRDACRQAAQHAAALLALRQTRGLIVPRPMSVRAFLTDLARLADVALEHAMTRAGLHLDRPIDEGFATAWGRLASELALSWPEASAYLRLAVVEQAGQRWSAPPALAARGRNPGDDEERALTETVNVASAAVANLDETRRKQLAAWEGAAENAMRTNTSTTT